MSNEAANMYKIRFCKFWNNILKRLNFIVKGVQFTLLSWKETKLQGIKNVRNTLYPENLVDILCSNMT